MSIVSRAARFLASESLAVGFVAGGILKSCCVCGSSLLWFVSQQEARDTLLSCSASGRIDGSRVACAQATTKDDSLRLLDVSLRLSLSDDHYSIIACRRAYTPSPCTCAMNV
jgi:hypothetical protein